MSLNLPFLHRINSVYEAPLDAYILYSMMGGIFYLNVKDYPHFILFWLNLNNPPPLTMDLASLGMHSILFDFDCKIIQTETPKFLSLIEAILKMTLLSSVKHFTYIVAIRKGSKGIHIHLPEFNIGYDDYIFFCELLQEKMHEDKKKEVHYVLDILTNAMLTGAAKPECSPYLPYSVVYVDDTNTHTLRVLNGINPEDITLIKKAFQKRKANENSFFRNILFNCDSSLIEIQLKRAMMPVITNGKILHTLGFASTITKCNNNSPDYKDEGSFNNKSSGEQSYIIRSLNITFNKNSSLNIFHYLKLNARNIINFRADNCAFNVWYNRFSFTETIFSNESLFHNVNNTLQFEHSTLADDPNPLKTLMQFNNGYYFLPIFYALCKHYDLDFRTMCERLYDFLDDSFHPLLNKIAKFNCKDIQYSLTEISFDTLHFCANNLHEETHEKFSKKLIMIVKNHSRAILSVNTHDEIVDVIRTIQDRHLPIRVFKLKHGLRKSTRYIWNTLKDAWDDASDTNISYHIHNLWNCIKTFINNFRISGGLGGPNGELIKSFNVSVVIAAIMSDTSMETKEIQMDAHKWFVRINDGVLDLLTGHIGGVVPDFYLSNFKLDVNILRQEMMLLCNDSPKYVALYEKLIDETFFNTYLENLYLDTNDSLMSTLRDLVPEINDPMGNSILHFFINICKCTSFEYDMFMYLLDILSSVFISTNYERKFFVWKGLTRNGKSKLFELMSKVFGSYYKSIQSENLSPGHSSANPAPELASTLFSCRMVTIEELAKKIDENRIKQLTGNSYVSFRNLYEQTSGGIPLAKLFTTTNNYPECSASEAFKDRVVAIPFDAEFTENAPVKTSEQVGSSTFPKDFYVAENSINGCFLMLYLHLQKFINFNDGLLHYRETPEYVIEFTEDYLIHADIYVQFKIFMDVQVIPNTITTLKDLKSAVRQYLKSTKNTSFHEADLIIKFEQEFVEYRKSEFFKLGYESFNFTSVLDEEDNDEGDETEEPRKKKKRNNNDTNSMIYYQNVIIKNLKRTNMDN